MEINLFLIGKALMNKIKFYPSEHNTPFVKEHVPPPKPSHQAISSWFRDAPRYQNNDKNMITDSRSGYHNLTVRHCMPFIDVMSSGYVLTTWTDIFIKRQEDEIFLAYGDNDLVTKFNVSPIQYQKNFQSHVPQMSGHDAFLYAWSTYWRIKTPEGTSCLFTQPFNRTDLPFFTLSGIIDTDTWNGSDVLNFALKKDFEGLIPKGTPYVQIMPFKRQEWSSEIQDDPDLDLLKLRHTVSETRMAEAKSGHYRDNLWSKKTYI